VKSRDLFLTILAVVIVLLSLPVWFITLMALIAGASWFIATGLVGLAMLAAAGFCAYLVYSSTAEDKMAAAREHNMERQVVAVSRKRNGFVTVTDLVAVGFSEEDASFILDHLARKGLCSINMDATKYSGVKTYVFPLDVKIRCKYCGTPLDVNMTRCPNCGAPVELTNVRPGDVKGPESK
jgi:DNA-directed RNA polymerase subunit RPC12/RpoP